MSNEMNWEEICELGDIPQNSGIAAILGGEQVAVFNVEGELYALSNYDPFSGANVIGRGIVGCIQGELVVATPIYKQHFKLKTGQCIESPEAYIKCFSVRVKQNKVQLNREPLSIAA